MDKVDVNDWIRRLIERDPFVANIQKRHNERIYREEAARTSGEEPPLLKQDGSPFLLNVLGIDELEEIKFAFLEEPKGKLSKEVFKKLVDIYCQRLQLTDLQFERVYHMMDLDQDDRVSWNDLIEYLSTELNEQEILSKGLPEDPEVLPIQGRPEYFDNRHSHVITSVAFWPTVTKDRKLDFTAGRFITTSIDGIVDIWNLNMKHLYSAKAGHAVPLKRARSCITKILAMTDLNLICVCTMDRELRFYDTKSDGFRLRTVICDFEHGLVTMEYHFYDTDDIKSWLAVGDTRGNIFVLTFSPNAAKVIFGQVIGLPFVSVRYKQVTFGAIGGLHTQQFPEVHPTWIETMSYYEEFYSLVTTCNSPTSAVILLNIHSHSILVRLDVSPGVFCAAKMSRDTREQLTDTSLAVGEMQKKHRFSHLLVTAGFGTEIRIWDLDRPSLPKSVIEGTTSSIVYLVVDEENHNNPWIYTYAREGVITVWDARSSHCLQVYRGLTDYFGPHSQLAICYNPYFKLLIVAAFRICSLKLGKTFDKDYSAGCCHDREITVCLYNYLYDVIVTAGADSTITKWHAFTGQKMFTWNKAHTREEQIETVSYGITTGAFSPDQSLLATGAMDGSIKMWNFHTGVCLRKMQMDPGAVLVVIWLKTKFFGIGFEGGVREWSPTSQGDLSKQLPKKWHRTITAACFVPPGTIVLGDVFGELLFINYSSGTLYKRYYVYDTSANLTKDIDYARVAKNVRNDVFNKKNHYTVGSVATTSIHFIYYLAKREQALKEGNILVALDTGMIQVWSAHPKGGLVASFHASHAVDDFVVRIVSDINDDYLFTGSVDGYLKLWLLKNFATKKKSEVSLPQLRLDYAFLAHSRWKTRAKRGIQDQPLPLLLNSFRAHGMAITSIVFIDFCKLVITAGGDRSVRYWSMTGQFLNQLGSTLPWNTIDPSRTVAITKLRIPPDLKRVMSCTTMKVLTNGYRLTEDGMKELFPRNLQSTSHIKRRTTTKTPHGKPLGRDFWSRFEIPQLRTKPAVRPIIDDRQVDILGQMTLYKMDKIELMDVPPALQRKVKMVFKNAVEYSGAPVYEKTGELRRKKQVTVIEGMKSAIRSKNVKRHIQKLVEEDLHPFVFGCKMRAALSDQAVHNMGRMRMGAFGGAHSRLFEEPMGKFLWSEKRFETDADLQLKRERMRHMVDRMREYKIKEAEKNRMNQDIELSREYLSNNLLTKKLRSGRLKDTAGVLKKLEGKLSNVTGTGEEAETKRQKILRKMDKLRETAVHDLKVDQMKSLGGNFWKPLFTSSESDIADAC